MTNYDNDFLSTVAKTVADRCHGNRKKGSAPTRYAMIYQAAYYGAKEALMSLNHDNGVDELK